MLIELKKDREVVDIYCDLFVKLVNSKKDICAFSAVYFSLFRVRM